MAKLYAEITSDKGGRVVGKGGDKSVTIMLRRGNHNIAKVILRETRVGTWEESEEKEHVLDIYQAHPEAVTIINNV